MLGQWSLSAHERQWHILIRTPHTPCSIPPPSLSFVGTIDLPWGSPPPPEKAKSTGRFERKRHTHTHTHTHFCMLLWTMQDSLDFSQNSPQDRHNTSCLKPPNIERACCQFQEVGTRLCFLQCPKQRPGTWALLHHSKKLTYQPSNPRPKPQTTIHYSDQKTTHKSRAKPIRAIVHKRHNPRTENRWRTEGFERAPQIQEHSSRFLGAAFASDPNRSGAGKNRLGE